MARSTISKVLYIQQFGRGMRLFEEKESLMVFDTKMELYKRNDLKKR